MCINAGWSREQGGGARLSERLLPTRLLLRERLDARQPGGLLLRDGEPDDPRRASRVACMQQRHGHGEGEMVRGWGAGRQVSARVGVGECGTGGRG